MLESKDMIRYIQRDELTHLDVFANAYLSCKAERPELFTLELEEECQELFREAVRHEVAWGKFSIQHGVPGLNEEGIELFIQSCAEMRARKIGLGGIFLKARNPYDWFDDYSSVEAMNKTQKNFFEGRNGRYSEAMPKFSERRTRAIA
jgi:ribonucleoside-diphosphate reductase beta chain